MRSFLARPLIAVAPLLVAAPVHVHGEELLVCPGEPGAFATIQEAVNASSSGDTIQVCTGDYAEDVEIVGRAISILGVPGESVQVGSVRWSDTGPGAMELRWLFIEDSLVVQSSCPVSIDSCAVVGPFTCVGDPAATELNVTNSSFSDGVDVSYAVGDIMFSDSEFAGLEPRSAGDITFRIEHQASGDSEVGTGFLVRVERCVSSAVDLVVDVGRSDVSIRDNMVSAGRIDLTMSPSNDDFWSGAISDNVVTGGGIYSHGVRLVSGNEVRAADVGIEYTLGSELPSIAGNRVSQCQTGILIASVGFSASVAGNIVWDCTVGVDIVVGSKHGFTSFHENTIYGCDAEAVRIPEASFEIYANIFAGSGTGVSASTFDTFVCNDVWGNTVDYAGVLDQTGSGGNISLDPLFCDPGDADFTLAEGSPCLAGELPVSLGCGQIGALGLGCATTPIGEGDGSGGAPTPTVTRLLPVAPNPFYPSARLSFTLASTSPVQLFVFDVTGRLVRVLIDGTRYGSGAHDVVWDGRDSAGRPLAPGVYHVRLVADGTRVIRTATLVR